LLAVLLSVVWLRLRGFDRLLDDTLLDRAFRFDVCALDHLLDDTLLDGCSASASTCCCWLTSTRAACQADQCPETSAQSESAET
jgi:hypothetical protein